MTMPAEATQKKKRLALIMSTEVGLKTQYLNWREHFPTDTDIEPVWIVIDFWKEGGFVEKLPIPKGVRGRIRGQMEVAEALKQGPFDGIFIAVHSVLAMFPQVLDQTACFMTFDVTPKQLHDFGDIYGKGPSRLKLVETTKHKRRAEAYQKCKLLFPWSHWAARSAELDYGTSPNRLKVIPPGVDLSRWNTGDRFTRETKPVCDLLFVGGDFERKGGPLLLEWAKRTDRQDFCLHLVTRQTLAVDDPRIKAYNGLSPNDAALVDLYAKADVFVLPTLADCYSLASIEAMASGLPVVLSETGGTGDVIVNGKTGFLLCPGNLDQLSQALDRLIADPLMRLAMGKAAREDAEQRYDARTNIHQTVALMRSMM